MASKDIEDMDVELTAAKIRQRSDVIVGVKVAHYGGVGWESVDRGVAAAAEAGVFCLIDQNARASRPFGEMMLEHMNPGDGVTHCYGYGKPMIGNDGKVKPHYWDAREKGIIMDVGHGNNSFSFSMAVPAIEQGFPPDTISTDLHRMSLAYISCDTDGGDEQISSHRHVVIRHRGEVDLDTRAADRTPRTWDVDAGGYGRCDGAGDTWSGLAD